MHLWGGGSLEVVEHDESAVRRDAPALEMIRGGEPRLSGADDDDIRFEPEPDVGLRHLYGVSGVSRYFSSFRHSVVRSMPNSPARSDGGSRSDASGIFGRVDYTGGLDSVGSCFASRSG